MCVFSNLYSYIYFNIFLSMHSHGAICTNTWCKTYKNISVTWLVVLQPPRCVEPWASELIEEGQLSRQHIPIESIGSLKMLSLPTFLVGFFLWVGSGKCNVNIPHIDPRKV